MRLFNRPFRSMVFACGIVLSLLAAPVVAGEREDARAQNASRVLREIQAIPESSIPDRLLDDAEAIVVIPDTIKAGLIFGARGGRGLMSRRMADGTWSPPVFVRLIGGSVGFQAGVQSSDVILVFRSARGLDTLINGKFTLGADASIAAGPLGRNAATATDGQLRSEIWSWSRARGLFAGVALDGAVLSVDYGAMNAAYNGDVTPRMALENRLSAAPSAAIVGFRDALEEATSAARARRATLPGAAPAPSAAPAPATAPTPSVPAPVPAQTRPLPPTRP